MQKLCNLFPCLQEKSPDQMYILIIKEELRIILSIVVNLVS